MKERWTVEGRYKGRRRKREERSTDSVTEREEGVGRKGGCDREREKREGGGGIALKIEENGEMVVAPNH